mmetsp:Transcript_24405/g.40936  ORF Transcript_24405/g.40936 Transcript_24405/m.40936 type:complete len:225 (-) Transcript_24405:111-785(-)
MKEWEGLKEDAVLVSLLALGLALFAAGLGGVLLAPLVDHADELEEDLLDVVVGLGRGLDEAAAKLLGESLSLLGRDLALLLQIELVAHNHDGDVRAVLLDTKDLVAELGGSIKTGGSGDTVSQNEALAGLHVLVTEGAVFLLSGGIHDVEHAGSSVDLDELAVRVLNGGIVLLHKVSLDETDSEGGLSDTSHTDENELDFRHVGFFCWFSLVVFVVGWGTLVFL